LTRKFGIFTLSGREYPADGWPGDGYWKLLQLQWSAEENNKKPIYVARVLTLIRLSHRSPIEKKTAVNNRASAYTRKIWIQFVVVIALEQIWRAADIDERRRRAPRDCYSYV